MAALLTALLAEADRGPRRSASSPWPAIIATFASALWAAASAGVWWFGSGAGPWPF